MSDVADRMVPEFLAMAEEIVRLRERVRELEVASAAGVRVTEAMVERFSLAYRICEETHERTFTHNMGIKAGLTAALTRPTTPTRGSDE